eukprot:m.1197228 g.1197228  ORF g.1197228 m.1197228 type:complete len:440 (+) comp24566_c0_seq1:409-1728(+)
MSGQHSLGARVVDAVHCAFQNDPDIDEVGYVLLDDESKLVVVDHHKLGLNVSNMASGYQFAHSEMVSCRQRRRSLSQWEVDAPGIQEHMGTIEKCTRFLCLLNSYCHTAWNERKRLLINRNSTWCLKPPLGFESELKFTAVVLAMHPKSEFIWSHRRWLLENNPHATSRTIPKPDERTSPTKQKLVVCGKRSMEFLKAELLVCDMAANRYPKNYYAWCHRQWAIQRFCQQGMAAVKFHAFVSQELKSCAIWADKNVSDYSSLHHITFLLGTMSKRTFQMSPTARNGNSCVLQTTDSEKAIRPVDRTPLSRIFDHAMRAAVARSIKYPCSVALWGHLRVLWFLWVHWCVPHDPHRLTLAEPSCVSVESTKGTAKGSSPTHQQLEDSGDRLFPIDKLLQLEPAQTPLAKAAVRWFHAVGCDVLPKSVFVDFEQGNDATTVT